MLKPPNIQSLTAELIEQFEGNLSDMIASSAGEFSLQVLHQRLHTKLRPLSVRIDHEDVEVAMLLGNGNLSAGLRVSLKLIAAAMKIEKENSRRVPWIGFLGG